VNNKQRHGGSKKSFIDWKGIIKKDAKQPEAITEILQPFTESYLNDLYAAAVEIAKQNRRLELQLKAALESRKWSGKIERGTEKDQERPSDPREWESWGSVPEIKPEPNHPCTVVPESNPHYTSEVAAFTGQMNARLYENRHKGHWQDCSRGYLLTSLQRAVDDLSLAHSRDHTNHGGTIQTSLITRRAADVANYAMMIADQEERK